MREGLVGLGHLVGVLALLDRGAEVVGGIHDLAGQPLLHGLLAAGAGVVGQPPQTKGLMTIVASLMSVIGYSLNDSIVVSDRIRENFRKIRRGTPYEIFNVSLTQTLHRTLITSGTTLMVILMLYLFGGPVLEGFSLTMLIGVSIGTASSIYVASALALKLGMKREHMLQQKVEKEGADQPSILP